MGRGQKQATSWGCPPAEPCLDGGDVHVWSARLDLEPDQVERLLEILSEGERARAEGFRFRKDRDHFVVAHGVLRLILGRYVGVKPDRLTFCLGAMVKPSLAAEGGDHALRFNLSHSHGLALYALARGREVGVDLERIQPDFPWQEMADQVCAPQEKARLLSLPAEAQPQAFFTLWVRKEAYLKARGSGLSVSPGQLQHEETPEDIRTRWLEGDGSKGSDHWWITDLVPGDGYVGALAAEGAPCTLRLWQFPPDSEPA